MNFILGFFGGFTFFGTIVIKFEITSECKQILNVKTKFDTDRDLNGKENYNVI